MERNPTKSNLNTPLNIKMSQKAKHIFILTSVTLLFVFGFLFRIKGVETNHSFWSDESFTSEVSRNLITGKAGIGVSMSNLWYQALHLFIVSMSFLTFGITEWSARFPSVVFGSLGIIVAYLLGKQLSDRSGGFLAAFIYTFFQLNLAYSTQARPYAGLETLLLLEFYLISLLEKSEGKKTMALHIASVLTCVVSSTYHYLGIFTWAPYLFYWMLKHIKKGKWSEFKKEIIPLSIFLIVFISLGMYRYIPNLFQIKFNWITYVRDLFWRQYAFMVLPALVGVFTIKSKTIKYSLLAVFASVLYFWTFIAYSHNIRYLMPLFGLLIVLFGVFWSKAGKALFKSSWPLCLAVALLIYAGGYKIVRKPLAYYTPNADFFADVQNADYKEFYRRAFEKFPDFEGQAIFVGPFDTLSWYSKVKPKALFNKIYDDPVYDTYNQAWVYQNLDDFIRETSKQQSGFVIVHDWQSFMPDDIKEYVKKNLKLEIRVESMSVSPEEKWPLELYSWGMK